MAGPGGGKGGKGERGGKKGGEQNAALLEKYDTNKDGKLDDAERKAVRVQLAEERFKKLDTNGNGALSLEEFKAGMAEREGHGRHGGGHR